MVVGPGRAQERRDVADARDLLEAEDALVERDRSFEVADIEHGVVEARDGY